LPKRFYRSLVEVRISRGRDDLDVCNVSLRIERQSGNGRFPPAQQRFGLAEMTAQAHRAIAVFGVLCGVGLVSGHLRPACLSIGRHASQIRGESLLAQQNASGRRRLPLRRNHRPAATVPSRRLNRLPVKLPSSE